VHLCYPHEVEEREQFFESVLQGCAREQQLVVAVEGLELFYLREKRERMTL